MGEDRIVSIQEEYVMKWESKEYNLIAIGGHGSEQTEEERPKAQTRCTNVFV